MSAIHDVYALRPLRRGHRTHRGDDLALELGDLSLPGWDEFTTARDRFFAGLRQGTRPAEDRTIAPTPALDHCLQDATD